VPQASTNYDIGNRLKSFMKVVEPDGIEPTTSSMPLKLSRLFDSSQAVLGNLINPCYNVPLALFGTSCHFMVSHRLSKTLEPLWNLEAQNAEARRAVECQAD
jgi:hypothetical protein